MYSIIRGLGASLLIVCAFSQTPPGTAPATSNLLSTNYGSTEVTPGIRLEITGQSTLRVFPLDEKLINIRDVFNPNIQLRSLLIRANLQSPHDRPLNPLISSERI